MVKNFSNIESKILLMKIALLAFVIFLSGCECAPDINTPKIISPDAYSNALMLNAIPDREILAVESNEVPLLNKISYTGNDNSYQKISSGDSYLRLLDAASNLSLFNIPLRLEKSEYYTIIFYGYRNSAKALVLKDEFPQSNDKALFRFVHTAFDAGNFVFSISGANNHEEEMPFRSFSNLSDLLPGLYKIKISLPQGNSIIEKDVQIKGGSIYTILLKGTESLVTNKPLIIDVIEARK
jgi:hypothetical protein